MLNSDFSSDEGPTHSLPSDEKSEFNIRHFPLPFSSVTLAGLLTQRKVDGHGGYDFDGCTI
jgi:hypothetical protein